MYTLSPPRPSAVDFVCDHPDIRAISFVGSDRVGKYIYERGSANGKRVQSNMVCWLNIPSHMMVMWLGFVNVTWQLYGFIYAFFSLSLSFFSSLSLSLSLFLSLFLSLTYNDHSSFWIAYDAPPLAPPTPCPTPCSAHRVPRTTASFSQMPTKSIPSTSWWVRLLVPQVKGAWLSLPPFLSALLKSGSQR